MPRYLLTCECGKRFPVDVGQAGGHAACECGKSVEVPPLSALRHLPVEASDTPAARRKWGTRQGVFAACSVLALLLVLIAAAVRFNEPVLPEFDAASRNRNVDQGLETVTPVEAWEMWIDRYLPLAESGFREIENPYEGPVNAYIARQRVIQTALVGAAAALAVAAIVALLWPRAKAPA